MIRALSTNNLLTTVGLVPQVHTATSSEDMPRNTDTSTPSAVLLQRGDHRTIRPDSLCMYQAPACLEASSESEAMCCLLRSRLHGRLYGRL